MSHNVTNKAVIEIGRFSIRCRSAQEQLTIREVLRGLGFKPFHSYDKDNEGNATAYQHVIFDGYDLARTGSSVGTVDNKFDSLQEFLDRVYRAKTQKELDIEAMERRIDAKKEYIAEQNKELTRLMEKLERIKAQ